MHARKAQTSEPGSHRLVRKNVASNGIPSGPLAQLQEQEANSPRAKQLKTLQAVAERQVAAEPMPAVACPVQRKRTVDDTARADFDRTSLPTFGVESVEKANSYYGQSLGKAGQLLNEHVMPWFTGAAAPVAVPPDGAAVKATVAGAGYKYFWTVGENEVKVYVGRSETLDGEASRAVGSKSDVPDSLYIYYENAYDVTEGRLRGINNDRDEDKSDNPDRPAALPNSTILCPNYS